MNTLMNICSHANCFAQYLKSVRGDVCGTMTTIWQFLLSTKSTRGHGYLLQWSIEIFLQIAFHLALAIHTMQCDRLGRVPTDFLIALNRIFMVTHFASYCGTKILIQQVLGNNAAQQLLIALIKICIIPRGF